MVKRREKTSKSDSPSVTGGAGDLRSFTFAPLSLRDIPNILDIERRSFPKPWSTQSFVEVISGSAFATYGVRSADGRLAAYLIYSEVSDELHILNIAVSPDFRRFGLGFHVLSKIHREASGRGIRFSFLEVRESNDAALRLYRKLGYERITRRKNYYSDQGEDAILMRAKI